MNNEREPEHVMAEPPPTVDLLQQLCERQRRELNRLNDVCTEREVQWAKMSADLLKKSEERKAELHNIQSTVAKMARVNKVVVSQRDVLETALTNLVVALTPQDEMLQDTTFFRCRVKAYVEARELLALIEQAKAKSAAEKPN